MQTCAWIPMVLLASVGGHGGVDVKISFGPTPQPVSLGSNKYLATAQKFADAMLKHGRDRYGTPTPMFMGWLDLNTLSAEIHPTANPNEDQDLYRLLYSLTYVSGDHTYARASDSALSWFLSHTGGRDAGNRNIIGWGEHASCGLGATTGGSCSSQNCEHSSIPLQQDDYWRLNHDRILKASQAYWDVGIGNKEKGYYNRHCGSTAVGAEYPRHGGFYMLYWSEAFKRTWDDKWLGYVKVLRRYFDSVRFSDGRIPASNTPSMLKTVWQPQSLSLTYVSATLIPYLPASNPLHKEMLEFGARNDDGVLTDWMAKAKHKPSFDKWANTMVTYILGATRYWQLRDAGDFARAAKYKEGILTMADQYLGKQDSVKWAGNCGQIIHLLLSAKRLSTDAKYFESAKAYADQGIQLFFAKGPIPRVTIDAAQTLTGSKPDWPKASELYVTNDNTGVATLPLALFMVGLELEKPGINLFFPSAAE